MSHKTELMLYKQVGIQVGWIISVDDDEIVHVSKDGYMINIPKLTGMNVHDLSPNISLDVVIQEYVQVVCTKLGMTLEEFYKLPMHESNVFLGAEVDTQAPTGKLEGIKRGVMHVIGAFGKKNKK